MERNLVTKVTHKTIAFFFDFASPNAYMAYRVLPGIAARNGATIHAIPCLLGGIFKATGNQAPMLAFAGVQGKLDYEMLEMQRFIKKHHLTAYQFNPHFPVTTLLAMRGAISARHHDVAAAYDEAMFCAMWERGLKLDDAQVFEQVLREAGLPVDVIMADCHSPSIKAELVANTEDSVARGAFGIPTFMIGREMFFGKERLGQVEEALHA